MQSKAQAEATALALANSKAGIIAFSRTGDPDVGGVRTCRDHPPVRRDAWRIWTGILESVPRILLCATRVVCYSRIQPLLCIFRDGLGNLLRSLQIIPTNLA